ncbi:hypothetical protein FRC12_010802 [Ceratobasidium sp. 428]|nr:hypothetical protein FRC12_010802 [Ceratobasidium sp. 428]
MRDVTLLAGRPDHGRYWMRMHQLRRTWPALALRLLFLGLVEPPSTLVLVHVPPLVNELCQVLHPVMHSATADAALIAQELRHGMFDSRSVSRTLGAVLLMRMKWKRKMTKRKGGRGAIRREESTIKILVLGLRVVALLDFAAVAHRLLVQSPLTKLAPRARRAPGSDKDSLPDTNDINRIWEYNRRRRDDEDEGLDDLDDGPGMGEEEREEQRRERRRAEKNDEIFEVFGDGTDYDWALDDKDMAEEYEPVSKLKMSYQDVFEPSEI